MTLFLHFLLVVVGFVMLIKGAEALVNGASSLAKRFHVPGLVIGLTIVALGTSAPELVVNILSGTDGHPEVVFGNIIGSNIFNLFLILGVAGVIYPLPVQRSTVIRELPFCLFITLLLFYLTNDELFNGEDFNRTSLLDGTILLGFFAIFLWYVFGSLKRNPSSETGDIKVYSSFGTTARLLFGLMGLGFGGKFVVDNAIAIAQAYEVSEKLVGLTIIAAGTSLPELATSAVAAYKRQADIAIGNVIGSNIFNILLVLGITTIITPLEYDTALNTDVFILLSGTVLLLIFMFTINKKKLDRWESLLYLATFIGYMIYLFIRK